MIYNCTLKSVQKMKRILDWLPKFKSRKSIKIMSWSWNYTQSRRIAHTHTVTCFNVAHIVVRNVAKHWFFSNILMFPCVVLLIVDDTIFSHVCFQTVYDIFPLPLFRGFVLMDLSKQVHMIIYLFHLNCSNNTCSLNNACFL